MKVDKRNGSVCFNEENHTYWNENDNDKYVSVTTLIERFTQPFDKNFWSAYKALEKLIPADNWKIEKKVLLNVKKFNKEILDIYDISENMFNKTQQDILDEWEQTNRESCERGTLIHSKLEHSVYNMGDNVILKKFGIGGQFICDKDRTNLDLINGVYPEYLISRTSADGILRLAGQIDLLVKNGNEIIIVDYKGLPLDTPILSTNGWTSIKEIKEGDTIFDKDGNSTKVLHKSKVHFNPCYKITFDNGETIVADHEHRWLINFRRPNKGYKERVMTTEELADWLNKKPRISYNIPKILNAKPLNLPDKNLPIDPYVLGCWLGDGSKSCGVITNIDSNLWDEISSRGYTYGHDLSDETHAEMRTIFGIRKQLNSMGLIGHKFIPDMYLTASYQQRLDLLRGFMDTDGYYHTSRKRFVMGTTQEWQAKDLVKLVSTLGIKATIFEVDKKCNGKVFKGWDVCFSTNGLNPFLVRNQDIEYPKTDKNSFRNIVSVQRVDTEATQCLEVDSPSHTFLFGHSLIVTHNTNKEIKQHSGFDSKTKSTAKMKYPLNNLEDCNFIHYTLQLSTYAWMIQKLNPEFIIKDLILVHFDHQGNQNIYHLDYLKKDVEKMLRWHKHQVIREKQKEKYKRIEY